MSTGDTSSIAAIRDRIVQLEARLGAPDAAARLEPLKAEIAALYRAVDEEIQSLTAARGEVKGLVERWKRVRDGAPSTPPGDTRASTRADHLGASTFVERGWSLLSTGDAVGAEAALRRALELSPGDSQAESLLGWSLSLQERYDEAMLVFQRVLVREPQNALAIAHVGFVCLRKGIFGEAIEHLTRAIRLDNDRKATLYAHLYLGRVYREREMFDDAESFLERAVEIGPMLIEAYFELGHARWGAGKRESALHAWQSGERASPSSEWGRRCAAARAAAESGADP